MANDVITANLKSSFSVSIIFLKKTSRNQLKIFLENDDERFVSSFFLPFDVILSLLSAFVNKLIKQLVCWTERPISM